MKTSITFSEPTWTFTELLDGNSKVNYEPFPAFIVISTLAVLGCIFNTFTTFFFKISKTALGKMVIALSIMDFIFSSSYMFLTVRIENEFICQLGSFLWVFGFVGSLSWSCCFAHCLYHSVKYADNQAPNAFLWRYRIASIILGLAGAITAVSMEFWILEVEVQRCVHPTIASQFDWSGLVVFFVPVLLSCLFTCVTYMRVISKIYQYRTELFLELIFYPLILLICDLPTAASGFYFAATREMPSRNSGFERYCSIMLRSQGFLNALAYGLSKRILQSYKELCRRKELKNKEDQQKLLMQSLMKYKTESTESLMKYQTQSTENLPKFVL